MDQAIDILDTISDRIATGQPFALATVVRTVAATAAKAGAKAVILPDGTISEGWIGGGCARAAVLKAAREALADGKPRLVSVQPPDALQEQGIPPGEERAGVRFAENMCPSQGTMDVFVEPVLPHPEIVVCGSSPVAVAVAELGKRIGFAVTVCAPAAGPGELRRSRPAHRRLCVAGRRGRHAVRRGGDTGARRRGRAAGSARSRVRTMWRSSAAGKRPKPSRPSSRRAASIPRGSRSSKRRPGLISAPSRRMRLPSPSWPKSSRCDGPAMRATSPHRPDDPRAFRS